MSIQDWLLGQFSSLQTPDAETLAARATAAARQEEIIASIKANRVPQSVRERLQANQSGTAPWIATLSPAELLISRSHGIRPIATVSATSWIHYGWSWTEGHALGWNTALHRLRQEAKAAGANAVVDVKMRTVPLGIEESMDFTLVGTAVKIDGLPASKDPIIATVPALEFVKLLEADIVPTGIAIGAEYQWLDDWRNQTNLDWSGNIESLQLSRLWEQVRHQACQQLQASAKKQGNGALAHINFSQMFEFETESNNRKHKRYLARYIVIATTVNTVGFKALPHDFQMVVDMHAGKTPLTGTVRHHQSYASAEDEDSAI